MSIIIYTTVGSKKEADKIAKTLVNDKLVACVNYFPVKSTYVWKNKIFCEGEYVLLCKTIRGKFNKIRHRIRKLNSYELPAIFSIKTDEVDIENLSWVRKSLK